MNMLRRSTRELHFSCTYMGFLVCPHSQAQTPVLMEPHVEHTSLLLQHAVYRGVGLNICRQAEFSVD